MTAWGVGVGYGRAMLDLGNPLNYQAMPSNAI
jgi:hypothetical protein